MRATPFTIPCVQNTGGCDSDFSATACPSTPDSSRAWRVAWDPVFFDLVRPLGGQFRFDLETYRSLDHAARRLFLLVSKIFDRRVQTPRFDVKHLAVEVLGFSPTLAPRHQRQKLQRVIASLAAAGVVDGPAVFDRGPNKKYTVVLIRGPRFSNPSLRTVRIESDSPLWDGLLDLGFEPAAARRLISDAPHRVIREWLDITLAAKERFGPGFFRRSPQAYLVDNVREAVGSGRTAPDWWHDLRSQEKRRSNSLSVRGSAPSGVGETVDHGAAILRQVTEAVFPAGADSGVGSSTPAQLIRPIR